MSSIDSYLFRVTYARASSRQTLRKRYQGTQGRYVGVCPTMARVDSRPAACSAWSVDEPVLDRVVSEVRIGFHSHLFQNARPVGADRLHRQVQLVGDLRHRRASGKLAEDLEFSLREL